MANITFYKLNSINNLQENDICIIVNTKYSKAFPMDASGAQPVSYPVTIDNSGSVPTITLDDTDQEALCATFEKIGSNYKIYKYNSQNYLYASTGNTALRVGTGTSTSVTNTSTWTYKEINSVTTSPNYSGFMCTSNSRYLANYFSSSKPDGDWRTYTTTTNLASTTTEIFVNRVVLPKLETPQIVSNDIYVEDSYEVSIYNPNSTGDIYYTTDGTTPTTSSTLYTGEFTINRPADPGTGYTESYVTITAKCFASGYEDSDEGSGTYTFYYVRNIADMWSYTSSTFVIQGIITYVDSNNHLFFIEDSTGGIRYTVTQATTFNDFSQYLVAGNEIKVMAQITSSSVSKNYVNKNLYTNTIKLISTGNTIPLATTTISSITAGNTTSIRVKLQDIVMLNTSGSTTGIYDNDDDSMMYIYNMPAKQGLKVGDNVDVIGVVYSNTDLNVQSANDITINQAPTPTGGGTLVQYQVSGTTVNLDGLVVIQTNKLVISQVTGGVLVAPQTKFFESGDTVVVTAIPDDGYQLDYFSPSGDASHEYSGNTCTLTFGNTDITIGATFVAS